MADPRTIRPEISPPVDGDKSKGGNMITRRLINKRKSELVAPLSPHEKEARMEELGSPQPTDPVSELPADTGDGIAESMGPTHTGNIGLARQVSLPTGQASGSAGQAAEPAGQASGPTGQAAEPAEQASGPAEQASGPAGQASEPAGQASGPVGQASGPAGQSSQPAGLALQPARQTLEPAEQVRSQPSRLREMGRCCLTTEKDQPTYLGFTSSVQENLKELAHLEPWISMYDRNVLYVLVQLLHSSLKGSGKLNKDTEYEIFMYAQTVNKIVTMIEKILSERHLKRVEGIEKIECGCNDATNIVYGRLAKNCDEKMAQYVRSNEIVDLLNPLDMLKIERPSYNLICHRHLCRANDQHFLTKVREIISMISTPLVIMKNEGVNKTEKEEKIDMAREVYLFGATLPDSFGREKTRNLIDGIRQIGKEAMEKGLYSQCWLQAPEIACQISDSIEMKDKSGMLARQMYNEKRKELYENLLAIMQIDDKLREMPSLEGNEMTFDALHTLISLQQEKQDAVLTTIDSIFDAFSISFNFVAAGKLLFTQLKKMVELTKNFECMSTDFQRAGAMFDKLNSELKTMMKVEGEPEGEFEVDVVKTFKDIETLLASKDEEGLTEMIGLFWEDGIETKSETKAECTPEAPHTDQAKRLKRVVQKLLDILNNLNIKSCLDINFSLAPTDERKTDFEFEKITADQENSEFLSVENEFLLNNEVSDDPPSPEKLVCEAPHGILACVSDQPETRNQTQPPEEILDNTQPTKREGNVGMDEGPPTNEGPQTDEGPQTCEGPTTNEGPLTNEGVPTPEKPQEWEESAQNVGPHLNCIKPCILTKNELQALFDKHGKSWLLYEQTTLLSSGYSPDFSEFYMGMGPNTQPVGCMTEIQYHLSLSLSLAQHITSREDRKTMFCANNHRKGCSCDVCSEPSFLSHPSPFSPWLENGVIYHLSENYAPRDINNPISLMPSIIAKIKRPIVGEVYFCFFLTEIQLEIPNVTLPNIENLNISIDPRPLYTKILRNLEENFEMLKTFPPTYLTTKINLTASLERLAERIETLKSSMEYHGEHLYCDNKHLHHHCPQNRCIYGTERRTLKIPYGNLKSEYYPNKEGEVGTIIEAGEIYSRVVVYLHDNPKFASKDRETRRRLRQYRDCHRYCRNHFVTREEIQEKISQRNKMMKVIRLSKKDRERLENKERANSFQMADWPLDMIANPQTMANAGFSKANIEITETGQTGPEKINDHAICDHCKIVLTAWTKDDIPIEEHLKWSPSCPFKNYREIDGVDNAEDTDAEYYSDDDDDDDGDDDNDYDDDNKYGDDYKSDDGDDDDAGPSAGVNLDVPRDLPDIIEEKSDANTETNEPKNAISDSLNVEMLHSNETDKEIDIYDDKTFYKELEKYKENKRQNLLKREGEIATKEAKEQTKDTRYAVGASTDMGGETQTTPLTPAMGPVTPLTPKTGQGEENKNKDLDINEHMPNLSELNQPLEDILKSKRAMIMDYPYPPGDIREYDREARHDHWSVTGILPPEYKNLQNEPTSQDDRAIKADQPEVEIKNLQNEPTSQDDRAIKADQPEVEIKNLQNEPTSQDDQAMEADQPEADNKNSQNGPTSQDDQAMEADQPEADSKNSQNGLTSQDDRAIEADQPEKDRLSQSKPAEVANMTNAAEMVNLTTLVKETEMANDINIEQKGLAERAKQADEANLAEMADSAEEDEIQIEDIESMNQMLGNKIKRPLLPSISEVIDEPAKSKCQIISALQREVIPVQLREKKGNYAVKINLKNEEMSEQELLPPKKNVKPNFRAEFAIALRDIAVKNTFMRQNLRKRNIDYLKNDRLVGDELFHEQFDDEKYINKTISEDNGEYMILEHRETSEQSSFRFITEKEGRLDLVESAVIKGSRTYLELKNDPHHYRRCIYNKTCSVANKLILVRLVSVEGALYPLIEEHCFLCNKGERETAGVFEWTIPGVKYDLATEPPVTLSLNYFPSRHLGRVSLGRAAMKMHDYNLCIPQDTHDKGTTMTCVLRQTRGGDLKAEILSIPQDYMPQLYYIEADPLRYELVKISDEKHSDGMFYSETKEERCFYRNMTNTEEMCKERKAKYCKSGCTYHFTPASNEEILNEEVDSFSDTEVVIPPPE